MDRRHCDQREKTLVILSGSSILSVAYILSSLETFFYIMNINK